MISDRKIKGSAQVLAANDTRQGGKPPLHLISDDQVRNLVRGALSADSVTAFAKTMERLHRECNDDDVVAVADALQAPYARHNGNIPPFPQTAVDEGDNPYYAGKRFDLELALVRNRIFDQEVELIEAIKCIRSINRSLTEGDQKEIAGLFNEYKSKYGLSLAVALKAVSFRNFYRDKASPPVPIFSVLEPFIRPFRQVVIGAFEATTDDRTSYLRTRRSFVNFVERNRIKHADAAIVTDTLTPLKLENYDLAHRLQSYSRRGLVDTVYFLQRAKAIFAQQADSKNADLIDSALPDRVSEAWLECFGDLKLSEFANVIGQPDQFHDMFLYAHLPAWSEYPEVISYRLAIEGAVGSRLDGRHLQSNAMAGRIAEPGSSVNEIVDSLSLLKINSAESAPAGGFHRSIKLVSSVESRTLTKVDGQQLYQLLDKTMDMPFLLSTSEIESWLDPRSDDLLYEYLRAALLNDSEPSPKRNHAVRRALQKLVQCEHNGNLVAFMESLNSKDNHVAHHFFNICSEAFITTLYTLYPNADEVSEAQAGLLEWWAENEEDEDAALRARSHRLLIRLRKVRGSIDSTRIYVDPLRLIEWMHDDLEDELSALINLSDEIRQDKTSLLSLTDPVGAAVQPKLRLLKLLDRAYREFCMNKVHGAASYIARRVRHGALHGHLVVELRPTIARISSDARSVAPAFADHLLRWFKRYDEAVSEFVKTRMHVRSPAKPQGLVIASLVDPEKSTISEVAIDAVTEFIADGPQMTQATAFILDYCWHFFEIDLKRARGALEELRRGFIINVNEHLTGDLEADSKVTDCIRSINEHVGTKFDIAKSWLTRPDNFSPSASVALMVEAVLDEVGQRFAFQRYVELGKAGEVDLIGHRFHFIYDALYILVVNAAKYGCPSSPVTINALLDSDRDPRFIDLTLIIGSRLSDENRNSRIAAIEAAMNAEVVETMDRMELDERSGLPKLRWLAAFADEIIDLRYVIEDNNVKFAVQIRYRRA